MAKETRPCFRAFKPRHNVPKANHAEIGHSQWVKIDAVNLSLIDICREDVAKVLNWLLLLEPMALVLLTVVKDPALLICRREGMLNKTRERTPTLKNWIK